MDRNRQWDSWNTAWDNPSASIYYFDNSQYYGVVAPNVEIHTYDFIFKLDDDLNPQPFYKGVTVDEKSLLWDLTPEDFVAPREPDHLRIHPEPGIAKERITVHEDWDTPHGVDSKNAILAAGRKPGTQATLSNPRTLPLGAGGGNRDDVSSTTNDASLVNRILGSRPCSPRPGGRSGNLVVPVSVHRLHGEFGSRTSSGTNSGANSPTQEGGSRGSGPNEGSAQSCASHTGASGSGSKQNLAHLKQRVQVLKLNKEQKILDSKRKEKEAKEAKLRIAERNSHSRESLSLGDKGNKKSKIKADENKASNTASFVAQSLEDPLSQNIMVSSVTNDDKKEEWSVEDSEEIIDSGEDIKSVNSSATEEEGSKAEGMENKERTGKEKADKGIKTDKTAEKEKLAKHREREAERHAKKEKARKEKAKEARSKAVKTTDLDKLAEKEKLRRKQKLMAAGRSAAMPLDKPTATKVKDRSKLMKLETKQAATKLKTKSSRERTVAPNGVNLIGGSPVCPAGHPLKSFKTLRPMRPCVSCKTGIMKEKQMMGCSACKYDLCEKCIPNAKLNTTRKRSSRTESLGSRVTDGSQSTILQAARVQKHAKRKKYIVIEESDDEEEGQAHKLMRRKEKDRLRGGRVKTEYVYEDEDELDVDEINLLRRQDRKLTAKRRQDKLVLQARMQKDQDNRNKMMRIQQIEQKQRRVERAEQKFRAEREAVRQEAILRRVSEARRVTTTHLKSKSDVKTRAKLERETVNAHRLENDNILETESSGVEEEEEEYTEEEIEEEEEEEEEEASPCRKRGRDAGSKAREEYRRKIQRREERRKQLKRQMQSEQRAERHQNRRRSVDARSETTPSSSSTGNIHSQRSGNTGRNSFPSGSSSSSAGFSGPVSRIGGSTRLKGNPAVNNGDSFDARARASITHDNVGRSRMYGPLADLVREKRNEQPNKGSGKGDDFGPGRQRRLSLSGKGNSGSRYSEGW